MILKKRSLTIPDPRTAIIQPTTQEDFELLEEDCEPPEDFEPLEEDCEPPEDCEPLVDPVAPIDPVTLWNGGDRMDSEVSTRFESLAV
jgi:hypothetical protein